MQPYKKELDKEPKTDEVKPFKQESFEDFEQKSQNYGKTLGFLGSFSSVFLAIVLFFVVAIVAQTLATIQEILDSKSLADYIYLFGFGFLLIVLIAFIYKNILEFRDFKRVSLVRRDFEKQKHSPNSDIISLAHFLINRYSSSDDEDVKAKIESLKNELNSSIVYENIYNCLDGILSSIDQKAKQAIHKASIQGALSTAISPVPIIDMFLIITRSVALSRQIAYMYGFKPGITTTTMLIKQGIINVMFAGVAELASEFTNQVASSSFLAKASKSLGQGVVNGILLARLGYGMMQGCRPIKSHEEKSSFFKLLLKSIKEALGG